MDQRSSFSRGRVTALQIICAWLPTKSLLTGQKVQPLYGIDTKQLTEVAYMYLDITDEMQILLTKKKSGAN